MENEFEPMYDSYVGIALRNSIKIPVRTKEPKTDMELISQTMEEASKPSNLYEDFSLTDVIGAQGVLKYDTDLFVFIKKARFFKEDGTFLKSDEAYLSKEDITALFSVPRYEKPIADANQVEN